MFPPLALYYPQLRTVSAPQTAFLALDCLEAMYGGAAGGGKSDALLAGALQYVHVPGYAALILRRTFKQLSLPGAIMARSKEWLKPHKEVHWSDDEKTWTFPSGATITFGYLDSADDIYRYQGPEFQYVGFDELTQFNEAQYTYLFSRVRRRANIPAPVRIRAASNPGGIGHAWVKARFPIAIGQTPDEKQGRVFVPAKVSDNPGLLADEYAESLSNLGEVLRAQLLNGDWGAFEGAAYPMFDIGTHVLEPFDIPASWATAESMDWGSTNATAWLAWAMDYDSNLIVFDELYVEEPQPHLPDDIVPLLNERRSWWHPSGEPPVCFADPSVYDGKGVTNRWGRPANVADEFSHLGVHLIGANRDRVAGYVRLAQLLRPDETRPFPDWHPRAGEYGAPRMFIFRGCTNTIEQFQGAPLEAEGEPHPGEAVSRKWEGPYGHAHAAVRYGVLSWPQASDRPREIPDDPRAALMALHEARLDPDSDDFDEWGVHDNHADFTLG